MRRYFVMGIVALAVAAGSLSAAPPGARAGDRELYTLMVQMTPEPSDESTRCYRRIGAEIREGYTRLQVTSRERLLEHLEREDGDAFMEWDAPVLEPVVRRGDTYQDAIVLVDCRPEERRVDVLVRSPARGVARMRLRRVEVDAARARWLTEAILRHGWTGFTP